MCTIRNMCSLCVRKCKTIERKLPPPASEERKHRRKRNTNEVVICVKYADRILSCNRICYGIIFLPMALRYAKLAATKTNTAAHKLNDDVVGKSFLSLEVKCRSQKPSSVSFFLAGYASPRGRKDIDFPYV